VLFPKDNSEVKKTLTSISATYVKNYIQYSCDSICLNSSSNAKFDFQKL